MFVYLGVSVHVHDSHLFSFCVVGRFVDLYMWKVCVLGAGVLVGVCLCTWIFGRVSVSVHVYMFMHDLCGHMHVHVWVHLCMSACLCVWVRVICAHALPVDEHAL